MQPLNLPPSRGGESRPGIKKPSIMCPSPPRYALTPEGLELAQKLAEVGGLSALNTGFKPEEHHGEDSAVPEATLSEP